MLSVVGGVRYALAERMEEYWGESEGLGLEVPRLEGPLSDYEYRILQWELMVYHGIHLPGNYRIKYNYKLTGSPYLHKSSVLINVDNMLHGV